jgi:Fanconi anemia group M protein
MKLGKLHITDFGVVIFDECHKAVGKYAYTYIADECKLNRIQLLGLTASPGSSRDRINRIVTALGIENIEIRTTVDPDVTPYVMDKSTMVLYVYKNSVVDQIMRILKPMMQEHLQKLYSKGLSYSSSIEGMPKKRIIEIGNNIQKIEARNYKFMALFHYVYLINLFHAYELVSTEGLYPFTAYLDSLGEREKKSRAVQSILSNKEIALAIRLAKESMEMGIEHPKMAKVVDLIKRDMQGKSVMVFAQYRSTIKRIAELLNANGISARTFAGKKEGITQQDQHDTIEEFRKGAFNVLVSTSIGEEGLDIPAVDAVIFYEPIPSEIRTIQRKGRAGRMKIGYVIILVTKGTKDEAYLTISRMREKRMKDAVEMIKTALNRKSRSRLEEGQQTL